MTRRAGLRQLSHRAAVVAVVCAVSMVVGTLEPGSAVAVPTGSIAGTVDAEATSDPIAGVPVCAVFERLGEEGEERYCDVTDALGEYEIAELPPHEYVVEFLPGTAGLNYLFEAWQDQRIWVAGDPVPVGAGAVQNIDADLSEGGELSGHVVNAASGEPVGGVEVCAEPTEFEVEEGCAVTGSDGNYTIYGLGTNEYRVQFWPPEELELIWQYWDAEPGILEADLTSVTVGTQTTGIDASLVPGARISGVVTDAVTGGPVAKVTACAEPTEGRRYGAEYGGCATTDESGRYTIKFVPADVYEIRFFPESELYAGAWYTGGACRGGPLAVQTFVGRETSGIDVRLPRRGEVPFCPEPILIPRRTPLIEVKRIRSTTDGRILLSLTARSAGKLSLRARSPAVSRGKSTTVAAKRVALRAGLSLVELKANRLGRGILRAKGKLAAKLAIRFATRSGEQAGLSRRIAFKLGRGR